MKDKKKVCFRKQHTRIDEKQGMRNSICLIFAVGENLSLRGYILAIIGMYSERGNLERQMLKMAGWVSVYGIVSYFFVSKTYAIELIGVLMVYPVLKLYNGERGRAKWMKWFFYIYYPLHLIIIGIIRLAVYGDINICL